MTDAPAVPRFGLPAAAAVAVAALYSATWRLDGPGWKMDEDAYARAGWSLVHDGVDTVPGHPPFAKLLYGGAQALFGRELGSVRAVAAVGFLVTAAVLFAFGRRLGGWWTGVAAAGLYAVLPRTMSVGGWTVADLRIERYGLLESVAAPLAVAALWCGWRWIVGDGSRWAVAAGALAGLAGATKITAAGVLVAVLVSGAAFRFGRPHLARDLAATVGAAAAAFLVPFAAFGRAAPDHVSEVLRFPGSRAEIGHVLVLGDDVYVGSPWWAHLRYAWDADGAVLVGALLVGLALAVTCRRRPAVVHLVVALGTLLGVAMASPVALPHYRALWIPPLLLLVSLGLVDAVERAASAPATDGAGRASPATLAGRWIAMGALVVLALVGALAVVHQATSSGGDEREVARQAAADGVRPTKVLAYGEPVGRYFPDAYDSLAPFDDGSVPAQLVVLDPSLTDAIDAASVERYRDWARSWGLTPHRVGRLEAWWKAP